MVKYNDPSTKSSMRLSTETPAVSGSGYLKSTNVPKPHSPMSEQNIEQVKPAAYAGPDNGFKQARPVASNAYINDAAFRNILKRRLPREVLVEVEPDLRRFADLCLQDITIAKESIQDPANYPRLVQYDQWCRRVDKLHVAPGWKYMHDMTAREGLMRIMYERTYAQHSRVYGWAKMFLYSPHGAVYPCPLAMTDGAARVLEFLKPEDWENYYSHILTDKPEQFWTSGQWMTERPGGSDVGNTETVAELVDPATDTWHINGFKWFSSATDSNMTLLLARAKDPATGQIIKGSRGLTLFIARVRNDQDELNGVRIHRLKNKFGTKGLPTAELELVNMVAKPVGQIGRGVPAIATMLNITRMHSGAGPAAGLRHCLNLLRDYSHRREVFGTPLTAKPLHIKSVSDLELTSRGLMQATFHAAALLGEAENPDAVGAAVVLRAEQRMRLFMPCFKAWSSKRATIGLAECMELMGGQGYMEENGFSTALADTSVNTIWEGTTAVLSLDLVRVLVGKNGIECWKVTKDGILESIGKAKNIKAHPELIEASERLLRYVDIVESKVIAIVKGASKGGLTPALEASARPLLMSIGEVVAASLLIEHAAWAVSTQEKEFESDVWCASAYVTEQRILGELTQDPADFDKLGRLIFGNAKM